MGRQSAIGGLVGKGRDAKAAKRRKKMGAGSFLRGGSPADDFLARFTQQRTEQQEQARSAIQDRLRSAGKGGGLFSRLFA